MLTAEIRSALSGLFAVCVLSAAVDALIADEARAAGVHAVCGLAIALRIVRLILGILK